MSSASCDWPSKGQSCYKSFWVGHRELKVSFFSTEAYLKTRTLIWLFYMYILSRNGRSRNGRWKIITFVDSNRITGLTKCSRSVVRVWQFAPLLTFGIIFNSGWHFIQNINGNHVTDSFIDIFFFTFLVFATVFQCLQAWYICIRSVV